MDFENLRTQKRVHALEQELIALKARIEILETPKVVIAGIGDPAEFWPPKPAPKRRGRPPKVNRGN